MDEQVAVVATIDDVKKMKKNYKRRPLTQTEQELAYAWAKSLVPVDAANPPDYVDLVGDEIDQLTKAVDQALSQVSVEDLKKIRDTSSLISKRIDSVDVGLLSPEAKRKWLVFKETTKDIFKRVTAFMDKYRSAKAEIDKTVADVIHMRDNYVEMANQTGDVKDETRESASVLLVAIEACRIYLTGDGALLLDQWNALVEEDRIAAEKEERYQNRSIVDTARALKDYNVFVESYMAECEGAFDDAEITVEGLWMQKNNLRLVAQTLNSTAKITVAAWKRHIWLAWVAFQGKDGADFIAEQRGKTNEQRGKSAKYVRVAAEAMAELLTSSAYDYGTLDALNTSMIESMEILANASKQAIAMYEENRNSSGRMRSFRDAAKTKYARGE
jgi:uncharacterized protein YaaN involved in tellurite resistance